MFSLSCLQRPLVVLVRHATWEACGCKGLVPLDICTARFYNGVIMTKGGDNLHGQTEPTIDCSKFTAEIEMISNM